MKCIVLSFDDGEIQDRRLIERLRAHGLKASFGLTCGYLGRSGPLFSGRVYAKTTAAELADTYAGFELCSHGFLHQDFTRLSAEELTAEIEGDRAAIRQHAGRTVRGAIYPGGEHDETVVRRLKDMGILYARTAESSCSFAPPDDFLRWAPTCHMYDSRVPALCETFEAASGGILHIYGHSYELDSGPGWAYLETLLSRLAELSAPSLDMGGAYDLFTAGAYLSFEKEKSRACTSIQAVDKSKK